MKSPKTKYDCDNCQFNWCCGISCSCVHTTLPNPDQKRQEEHAQAIRKINPDITIEEIRKVLSETTFA